MDEVNNEFKIGCFVGNLEERKITVELLGPEDPSGQSERKTAFVGIELSKSMHRKLARAVERLTRVTFEAQVDRMEKRYDPDED